MTMKFFRIFLLMALAAFAALSCKKDEETEVEYMDGSIRLDFPTYVQPGYSQTFKLEDIMTVTRPDGGEVGYYYTDPFSGERDTLRTEAGEVLRDSFEIVVEDTLANLTLSATAYGGDYVNTTGSKTFTVVKPGFDDDCSITGFSISEDDPTFTDERDGKTYYYTTIGDARWMRQNLAWEGAGAPFKDCEAMTPIFGRYYTWEEAQSACPDGWRLPADEDWAAVAEIYGDTSTPGADYDGLAGDLMEDLYFNGTRMWEYWREVDVTNAARLSVMPVGYASVEAGSHEFDAVYEYASFWTADETGGFGVCRYIVTGQDIVYYGNMSKTDFACSVRCVSDEL